MEINEFAVLMIIVVSGMAVGLCFDFYRIVRWKLKLNKVFTFLFDVLFAIFALGLIYFFAQKANYLELRFYLFIGSLVGLLLYLVIFSRIVNKILQFIFRILAMVKQSIFKAISQFIRFVYTFLSCIMRLPYRILRWAALLLYRIGEGMSKDSAAFIRSSVFRRITKR
ncbi:spore cortex biosynthesis protein YabQ [Dehalobacter sp. DCM]|uniref:spore cortex biosynthesis protein YabQ n=1 Tax=Dehalobacter sp. DCM TaxID=2907827 RepID=UPI0030821BA5|nr:spore cortex biosynthesis protein YabQ [Dehalobacter sp. DCM]